MLSKHGHFSRGPQNVQFDGGQLPPIYQGLLSSGILWRASKRQLSSPIVAGFFSAELFVPSSILLPRLEIPPVLSSQECSTHWPDSLAGSGGQDLPLPACSPPAGLTGLILGVVEVSAVSLLRSPQVDRVSNLTRPWTLSFGVFDALMLVP